MPRQMRTMLNILLWIFAFACQGLVNAGHPLWESSLKGVKHAFPIDLNSRTVTTWPAYTVYYAWEDGVSGRRFRPKLQDAMQLWYAAGLPDRFRFEEWDIDECNRIRMDCLVISGSPTVQEWFTTIGKYIARNTGIAGSSAIFNYESDLSNVGSTVLDKVTHQIGHIFGLHHEHQYPWYWGEADDGRGPGVQRWDSLFRMNCKDLLGYEEAAEGLSDNEINGPLGMCNVRAAALERGFVAASHILPRSDLFYIPHPEQAPQLEDVDWDSIMLYNSKSGAKRGRYFGLIKNAEGAGRHKISRTRVPTQKDVIAILQLYDQADDRMLRTLYHDPHSEYFPEFDIMRNFAACDVNLHPHPPE